MSVILYDLIPYYCQAFIDDICIWGLRDDYDNKEFEPGIRRFVVKYLLNVNKVLLNYELTGALVVAVKS